MGSPGKNAGVGCDFLLQEIFLTQGLNSSFALVGRFLPLSHQGGPYMVNTSCLYILYRKDRETRDQVANILWIIDKLREFQKTSALLTTLKPLTVDYSKLWEILRDGNTRTPDLLPEKSVCRSRSNSLDRICNNGLVPLERKYHESVYCHLAYLTRCTCEEYIMWPG